jgi:hypothetical protein
MNLHNIGYILRATACRVKTRQPHSAFFFHAAAQGGAGILACPLHSTLVEWPLAFDAVELCGFPVDALLDHFEAVGGVFEIVPLSAGATIAPSVRFGVPLGNSMIMVH